MTTVPITSAVENPLTDQNDAASEASSSSPLSPTPSAPKPVQSLLLSAPTETSTSKVPGGKTGRKISKRACDACKIRKIKCSEKPPCEGCRAVGISCTFNKKPATRGPRKLRTSTIQEIAQAQQKRDGDGIGRAGTSTGAKGSNNADARLPTASIVLQLCIYRLRMYSVWPIVEVEEIIASLQSAEHSPETYALANAIGAATLAQLKLADTSGGVDVVTADRMEEECQIARKSSEDSRKLNMETLRTAFFLHIYHDNRNPGGLKSILYLREAITMAQMMRLDRETSYKKLDFEEQQVRRRLLWLLFITERGVAMLHKLPVVLHPNIAFPTFNPNETASPLPAFQKLVNLFWIFDQSNAFDILQESEVDVFRIGGLLAPTAASIKVLQTQLQNIPISDDKVSDVQAADIAVTRQWMRSVLWRASANHDLIAPHDDEVKYCSHPFQIAKDFLEVVSRLPKEALEAHGLCMELKMFEIATSVTDAIAHARTRLGLAWKGMSQPREMLNTLHGILSTTRGGNETLVGLLRGKIAVICNAAPVQHVMDFNPGRVEELDEEWVDHGLEGADEMDAAPQVVYDEPALLGYDNVDSLAVMQQASFSCGPSIGGVYEHRSPSTEMSPKPICLLPVQQHPSFIPFEWVADQQAFPLDMAFFQSDMGVYQNPLANIISNNDSTNVNMNKYPSRELGVWDVNFGIHTTNTDGTESNTAGFQATSYQSFQSWS